VSNETEPKSPTAIQRAFPVTSHILTGSDTVPESKVIPDRKRWAMVIRTCAGSVPIAAVVIWGAKHGMKQEYVIGLTVLAAVVASGQLVTAPLRDVVTQVIRLILAIRKGEYVNGNGNPPPPADGATGG
jgi:hypothetical protein